MLDAIELAAHVVRYLNNLHGHDPDAIEELVECRVKCDDRLVRHKTCVVSDDAGAGPVVGILGVLNGLLRELSDTNHGPIQAHYIETRDGLKLSHFSLAKGYKSQL